MLLSCRVHYVFWLYFPMKYIVTNFLSRFIFLFPHECVQNIFTALKIMCLPMHLFIALILTTMNHFIKFIFLHFSRMNLKFTGYYTFKIL